MAVLTQGVLVPPKSIPFPVVRSGSLFVSFVICGLIVLGFVTTADQFVHWFVFPVLARVGGPLGLRRRFAGAPEPVRLPRSPFPERGDR